VAGGSPAAAQEPPRTAQKRTGDTRSCPEKPRSTQEPAKADTVFSFPTKSKHGGRISGSN